MSKISARKPLAIAVGAALAAGLGTMTVANAEENPFGLSKLSTGYMCACPEKEGEGKCGEGKCGGEKSGEGKCGEGKCGGEKSGEGKCGEGKCGGGEGHES